MFIALLRLPKIQRPFMVIDSFSAACSKGYNIKLVAESDAWLFPSYFPELALPKISDKHLTCPV
jgi:hypothetical protein